MPDISAIQTAQGKFHGKEIFLADRTVRLDYEAVYGRPDNYNVFVNGVSYGTIWLVNKSEDEQSYWVGHSYNVQVLQIDGLPTDDTNPDPDIIYREEYTKRSSEEEIAYLMKRFIEWVIEGVPSLVQAQRVRALAEQRVRNPDGVRANLQGLFNRLTLAQDIQPGEAEALDWAINSCRSGFSL